MFLFRAETPIYPPNTSIFSTLLLRRKPFTRFTPQGRLDGGAMQGADATAWDAQHHLLGMGI